MSNLIWFICVQSGTGSCLLIQCQNSSCSHTFHTFCLNPPMQNSGGTLECPLCKINQASLPKRTEVNRSKKIQRFVGCRRVILQESDFQYQFLVKWHLLSHHHDCWVCFAPCHSCFSFFGIAVSLYCYEPYRLYFY